MKYLHLNHNKSKWSGLLEDGGDIESFTEDELVSSLKGAKRKFDGDALRKWKSERKKQIE
jgi:hypothetical protein